MNRATAETGQKQALAEGLGALMSWVKDLIDRALSDGLGCPDLEFAWVFYLVARKYAETRDIRYTLLGGSFLAAEGDGAIDVIPERVAL